MRYYLVKYHEFTNNAINDFLDTFHATELRCYASEFVMDFDLEEVAINEAIERAVLVCRSSHIPPYRHFRKVYRFVDGVIIKDWRLSPYACFLVLVNADPNNPMIAKFQSSLIVGD